MEWSHNLFEESGSDVATTVLKLLQPHSNMKTLAIKFYHGREFPSWIGDSSLMCNMVELELCNCRKSTSLPSLGRLPVLKKLKIQGMKAIKSVGFEFCGCDLAFPALETLKFEDMLGWEKWCSYEVEWKFPRLRELEMLNCPLLIGECIISLPSLSTLKLEECNESLLRCMIDLNSLTTLRIEKMSGLSCLHESVGQMLVALKHLELYECEDLTSLWQIGVGIEENFKCLTSLDVRRCPKLVSFLTTSTIKKMAFLEKVTVMNFPDIGSVPMQQQQEENGFPRKLSHVELEDCGGQFIESMVNGLMTRPHDGNCVDVVEHLKIRSCDSLRHLEIISAGGGNKLKMLEISDCKNLVSLCNSGPGLSEQDSMNTFAEIEELYIYNCPSLTTEGMKLPVGGAVKTLNIKECNQIKSLPEECIMSTSSLSSTSTVVEAIMIRDCPNLKRLLDSLHSLTNLTYLGLFGNGYD